MTDEIKHILSRLENKLAAAEQAADFISIAEQFILTLTECEEYSPEYMPKKCPWWHRLFRRFKWFRHHCRWCMSIKFESVTLPVIRAKFPKLDLQGLANVMPLTIERNKSG